MKKILLTALMAILAISAQAQKHWTNNPHLYANTMTVVGVVVINDAEIPRESIEVGAFCNGECRGSERLLYKQNVDRYLAYLSISGANGDVISFRLYDEETEVELQATAATVTFEANAMLGRAGDPYVFGFTTTEDEVPIVAETNEVGATGAGGEVVGEGSYLYGEECTLTAVPDSGCYFLNWTENVDRAAVVVSTDRVYTFVVTGKRDLVANFTATNPAGMEQTLDFDVGWNWISSYVECSPDLLGSLQDGIGSVCNKAMIKNMTSSSMLQNGNWSSGLTFENESMYMVNLPTATSVTLTAPRALASLHPVTLIPGWNWIGFPSDKPMTLGQALSSLTPNNGDLIKSMENTSSYSGGEWQGSLENLVPGEGYMYYNASSDSMTLVYPDVHPTVQGSVEIPESMDASQIVVTNFNEEVVPDENGNFEIGEATVMWAKNSENGRLIYISHYSADYEKDRSGRVHNCELNAKETAIHFALCFVPFAVYQSDDETFNSIKDVLYDLPQVQNLETAIENVVSQYGYLEANGIKAELQALWDFLRNELLDQSIGDRGTGETTGICDKLVLRRDGSITSLRPYLPIGRSNWSRFDIDKDKTHFNEATNTWTLTLTGYSNYGAYMGLTKGWIDDNNQAHVLKENIRCFLPPMTVGDYIGTFTSFDGLRDFFSDTWSWWFEEGYGWDDMTYDMAKLENITFELQKGENALCVLSPKDNEATKVWNIAAAAAYGLGIGLEYVLNKNGCDLFIESLLADPVFMSESMNLIAGNFDDFMVVIEIVRQKFIDFLMQDAIENLVFQGVDAEKLVEYVSGAKAILAVVDGLGFASSWALFDSFYLEIDAEYDDLLGGYGTLPGAFTVNAQGNQVSFSQGNLQYQASNDVWRFADHQWDCVGSDNANISASYNGWIDLFGWGTSGYDHGATCYQPWSKSTHAYDYYNHNLFDQTGRADWGYNTPWRTLTHEEWAYLLDERSTASGIRYAKAQVNGVNGVILLPDNWNTSYCTLNGTNQSSTSYSSNSITGTQWDLLEDLGAVFLPAAGERNGTSINDVGEVGYYWSSSIDNQGGVWFVGNALPLQGSLQHHGMSVRLARTARESSTLFTINVTTESDFGIVNGGGQYALGSMCTVTATALSGYVFEYWTENGSFIDGNASYTFPVTCNRDLVAVFAPATAVVPSVTTYPIDEYYLTTHSALLTGNVQGVPSEYVSLRGFCYHTSSDFDIETEGVLVVEAGEGVGDFGEEVSGLDDGTRYYYKAFVLTSDGAFYYGEERDFTTLSEGGGNDPSSDGALNGIFTVNADGDQVFFSQGNLQYIGSAGNGDENNTGAYWKFADHQWDYLGDNGQSGGSKTIDRDLFGWGTSGWDSGNTYYQPWSTSMQSPSVNPSTGYGPTDGTSYYYDLNGDYANADWGVYNAISNGGNTSNTWRTLTAEEWYYLLNDRSTTSGARYVKAQVHDVPGIILLPDDWNAQYYGLNNANESGDSFTSNIISNIQWEIMENHGAVFLPAAGFHNQSSFQNSNHHGFYWSATFEYNYSALGLNFYDSYVNIDPSFRYYGHSVRLVRPVSDGYTIQVIVNPSEGGTITGAGSYQAGEECTLTATPALGYEFSHWTEQGVMVSTFAAYSFTVTGGRSLVANFVPSGSGNTGEGALTGVFTVNANGGQVNFSQGNLQYQASTNTWRFAENQWDYVGDGNINICETYSGWIDLFGWGTSGYHDTSDPYNVNYHPWSISKSTVNQDYNEFGYGPSTNMPSPNLTGSSANYDWGVYNPISNGGNQAGLWRTLTHEEWSYVFNTRSTSSGIRYAKAQVNGVNGVILLPDDWSSSFYSLSNTNNSGASFGSNTITASQWNTLEQHGAVFLPAAAGYRSGTSVILVGSYGDYWSASYLSSYYAWNVSFSDDYLYTDGSDGSGRYFGFSVRLVRSAQ